MKTRGLLPAQAEVGKQLLQQLPEFTLMQGLGGRRQIRVQHLRGTHTLHNKNVATDTRQAPPRSLPQGPPQLTRGKRVDKPSDDPVAAARAERALAAMTRSDSHQRALQAARSNTQLTESALGVDSESLTGATRVYEDCGFLTVTVDMLYRKPLESSS